jgi:hypothetical protein
VQYASAIPLPIAKIGVDTTTLPAWIITAAGGPLASIDVMLAVEAYSIIGKEQSPTRSTTHPSSAHSRELSYHRPSCTQEEAIRDSVEYSEVFDNRLRHRGTLRYHSPAEFAIQA